MGTMKTRFAAARAKALRKNATDAEHALWQRLRARQLDGCKFVRQHAVGRYIADFACRERNLVIEIDGGQHAERASDAVRTAELGQHGYRVLRFWNTDILANVDGVLLTIRQALADESAKALRWSLAAPQAELHEKRENAS